MALRLGTSEYGGTFYTQGSAFAELFNRGRSETDRCVVETSEASIHNANMLDRGELEFGFMASNWIGRAKDAKAAFHAQDLASHGGADQCRADVLCEVSKLPDPDHRRFHGQAHRYRN